MQKWVVYNLIVVLVLCFISLTLLMLQSLLDVPVETSKGGTKTEPMIEWVGDNVKDYNGIYFILVKKLDDFICLSTAHAALYGMPLVLVGRKNNYWGTMLHKVWKCPCCCTELTLVNQGMVRSKDVAHGATHS